MMLALAGQCVPAFWLGLMLILLFSVGVAAVLPGPVGAPSRI